MVTLLFKSPKKGSPLQPKILSWLEELAGIPSLLLSGLLSLLILQGKVNVPVSQPHDTGQSDPKPHNEGPSNMTGSQVKAGTQFIIVSISLYRLGDIV